MALTGIEIFKMLPKTNCKECGFPTCLAFAMGLASGKAELDKCPYVSDEAKEKLAAASAPPIRPVKLAMKDGVKTIGGETVMFRHEKTFVNPPPLALLVTVALALVRALAGPTVFDRAQAANTIGTAALLALAVLGFLTGRPDFLDLAITYGILNLVGTIAVLKFFTFGDLGDPGEASKEDGTW